MSLVDNTPTIRLAGDRFLLVEFGREMDLANNFRAQGLRSAIRSAELPGIIDLAPCFATLLVEYDCDRIEHTDLAKEIERLLVQLNHTQDLTIESRLVLLPAVYLDPWTRSAIESYNRDIKPRGYDPLEITKCNGLADLEQFVRVHSGSEYWVAAIGSWPGLPFMMALDPRCRLSAPKYDPPRTFTPRGAVGLGGASTAVYSVESPGGYQIFARTPVPIWSEGIASRRFADSLVLLRPGDRVRFCPISVEEFADIEERLQADNYVDQIIEYQNFSVEKYHALVSKLDPAEHF